MPNKPVQAAAEGLPKIPDFPLPACNRAPSDDVSVVRSMLNVIGRVFEDGSSNGLAAGDCHDLFHVIDVAIGLMRPIQLYLDELDGDDALSLYQECRRRVILETEAAS